MKKRIILLMLLAGIGIGYAQTPEDSVKIIRANWSPQKVKKGIVYKHAPFKFLYGVPQNVNVIEIIPEKKRNQVGVFINEPVRETSKSAQIVNADAAINGSYYHMKQGNSACFLKIGPDVIDTTHHQEFSSRVNGALRIDKGKLSLIPWDKQTEKMYNNSRDIVLAAGPLMLNKGNMCDFSQCDSVFIHTRHPRSAIGITADGHVLMVTVDGYFPHHAVGMDIPEFAFLLKLLGCTEALNLDGGGSTTLWAQQADGVLNMPSDDKKFGHSGERSVANIIYVK
ncbi:MAG: phosphodiester glycosidase family protein [Bacteroidales bacterium]